MESRRSISTMFAMCPEKVLRLAAIDCSSPMSANTDRNTGTREPAAAGMCRPACAISDSSPAVFSATVFPPVFGPVMTSARVGGVMMTSTGTGSMWSSAPVALPSRLVTAAISSGCLASWSSRVWSSAMTGSTPPTIPANDARACSTSRSVATVSVRRKSAARRRNIVDSASNTRRTSSRSCSSSATISLLMSTVLNGSRKRLAPLDEVPCTMPGMAVRCSDRTTSTKRPLRSLTTCSCRYREVSRPRRYASRLPRRRLRCLRRRPRIVFSSGLASSVRSPDASTFLRTSAHSRFQFAEPPTIADRAGYGPLVAVVTARQTRSTDPKKATRLTSCAASSGCASIASASRVFRRFCGASRGIGPFAAANRAASVVCASAVRTARGSVSGRSRCSASAPSGVKAQLTSASTIRSNSRVVKVPVCIELGECLATAIRRRYRPVWRRAPGAWPARARRRHKLVE